LLDPDLLRRLGAAQWGAIAAGDDLPKEISTMFYYSDLRLRPNEISRPTNPLRKVALCEHIKGNWLFVLCGGLCVAMLVAVVLSGSSVN
jgi:hypothetical protein